VSAAPTRAADAAECAARAQTLFEAAAGAAGCLVRTYSVAGRSLRLRFAGPALVARLSGALDHHPPARPGEPTLTVSIWDTASTGVPLPPVPADAADGGTTARARIGPPPAVRVKYRPEQRSVSLLDRGAHAAAFAVADGAALPYWETGAPLRPILHWWMADHGRQLVHAGAVGTAAGGLLLAGPGGTGKSSAALACLGSALGYAGDDYCLVSLDPAPRAHSVYSSAKLGVEQARRFPGLRAALVNPGRLDTDKALFLLQHTHPGAFRHTLTLRALVVPTVRPGGRSTLEPASPGAVLRALAPSSILQLPGAGRAALATLARLVQRVPGYVLRLGPDLDALPALLAPLATAPQAP
jgi:hypothetical protein